MGNITVTLFVFSAENEVQCGTGNYHFHAAIHLPPRTSLCLIGIPFHCNLPCIFRPRSDNNSEAANTTIKIQHDKCLAIHLYRGNASNRMT